MKRFIEHALTDKERRSYNAFKEEIIMTNPAHGGSRPVSRQDDGRLRKQPGYAHLLRMRYLSQAEEAALKQLTPRQRVEFILKWIDQLKSEKK